MTVSIELQMEQMGQRAKKAARVLSAAAPAAKTQALRALAALLIERQPDILKANALDVDAAKAANMDAPRLDRLTLTPRIMADMADACLHVAEMADEVGVIEQQWQRPNGLMIGKMRIPLGGHRHDFRVAPQRHHRRRHPLPKAGDAVILRGGSEAIPFQPRAGRAPPRSAAQRRVARGCGAGRGNYGSRRRRRALQT